MFYWSCSSAKTDLDGHACYSGMTALIVWVFILLVSACAVPGYLIILIVVLTYKFLQAGVYGWLQKQQNERFTKPHMDSNYTTHLGGKGSMQPRCCICVTNINKLEL